MSVLVARWGAAAAALVLAVGACNDDADSTASTTSSTAPTPTFVGDGSPFCNAMLDLGQIRSAEGATPQQVLAANEQLVAQLDEAQANAPADAPADFEALIDDYRLATSAIFDAKGDVVKAFEALAESEPEVVGRLQSETSHEEAFEFLADRCGINSP